MNFQEKISKRQEANLALLDQLREYIEKYPQQRWGQILSNYGFIPGGDPFYEESVDTLRTVVNTRKKIEEQL